jgi:cation transport protein ChaC
VCLADGSRITALCYVVDRSHHQYSGVLALEEQHRLVRQGQGRSGANIDYVLNTVRHLEELGIADARLAALARLLDG